MFNIIKVFEKKTKKKKQNKQKTRILGKGKTHFTDYEIQIDRNKNIIIAFWRIFRLFNFELGFRLKSKSHIGSFFFHLQKQIAPNAQCCM